MSLLDVFRSQAGSLRAQLQSLRDRIETAKRKRQELCTLPLPVEELVEIAAQVLARRAAEYQKRLLPRLNCVTENPLQESDAPGLQMSALLVNSQGPVGGQEAEAMLAYFFPDQVRAGLERALAACVARCGPGRVEREAELKKLDAQIGALEREEAELLAEFEVLAREARL